jgi:hypothetical protein
MARVLTPPCLRHQNTHQDRSNEPGSTQLSTKGQVPPSLMHQPIPYRDPLGGTHL